jgi:rod shape determining protein RodA
MSETNWRHFDFWLLGAVVLLTIFGITMIRSAVAGNIELVEETNLVQRQLLFAGIGFVVVFVVASIDYRLWASISRPMYIVTVLALAILTIAGQALYGSARWFDTGVILIQPSEIAKIVVILTLADFFTRHQEQIGKLSWVARSLVFTLGIVVWIILQPNLSTSLVILAIWFALLWATGLKLKHLMLFIIGGIVLPFLAFPFLEDYQQRRVLNFIFPDPQASYGEQYNLQQALISIGSGGWFGKGYMQGTQSQLRFLKVRWSDFIFSVIGEEFGFVGIFVMMLLLLFVVYRVLWTARKSRDTFGALICYGIATLISFQAIVNIGVNLQLMPATGLTLPFVSYGGSSLLSLLLGVGLVESVALRYKSLEFKT